VHNRSLRVLIVDDHPMMRRGLRGVLEEAADLLVVAEACDGNAAVDAYRTHVPDVTLMDLVMPGGGGIEAIRTIRAEFPQACVVALTTYASEGQVARALAAGAAGYVLKSAACDDTARLVRAAHAGCRVMAPEAQAAAGIARHHLLTARERQLLSLVARGHGNRAAAQVLGIAEETAKGYLSNIMQKLHARDRTHAVVIAMQRGLLDAETQRFVPPGHI
jgi:DNA-binding NarL/FixJ family response regulator